MSFLDLFSSKVSQEMKLQILLFVHYIHCALYVMGYSDYPSIGSMHDNNSLDTFDLQIMARNCLEPNKDKGKNDFHGMISHAQAKKLCDIYKQATQSV